MEESTNAIVAAFYARVMRRVCDQYRENERADAEAIALIQQVRLWRPPAVLDCAHMPMSFSLRCCRNGRSDWLVTLAFVPTKHMPKNRRSCPWLLLLRVRAKTKKRSTVALLLCLLKASRATAHQQTQRRRCHNLVDRYERLNRVGSSIVLCTQVELLSSSRQRCLRPKAARSLPRW